jgi:diadenosine tetraphosphate (Ap4A) HIT family hydrolase
MSSIQETCAICQVIHLRRYIDRTEHGVIFEPDNKLVDGHLIVAPLIHVINALVNPTITAQVIRMAAMRAKHPCSIVIPVGVEVGQAHDHLYVHIVPAEAGQVGFHKNISKGK